MALVPHGLEPLAENLKLPLVLLSQETVPLLVLTLSAFSDVSLDAFLGLECCWRKLNILNPNDFSRLFVVLSLKGFLKENGRLKSDAPNLKTWLLVPDDVDGDVTSHISTSVSSVNICPSQNTTRESKQSTNTNRIVISPRHVW